MDDDAITRLTIGGLLAAQRAGTLRATDILAAYLARAAAVNPRINAIVARDDAAAQAAAHAADRAPSGQAAAYSAERAPSAGGGTE